MRILFHASILLFFIASSQQSFATWDIYKSGVSINGGYYDCQYNTIANDLQHTYFGRYVTGGTITLNFAEVYTFKNVASNVCSANLYYRVYRSCDTPPAFTALSLPFCCNFGGTDCSGGPCGPDINNPGDQKWRGNSGANIMSGLTASGLYIIEVYFDANGDDSGGCTGPVKYSSNGGNNYRAYFELNTNDFFSDLDLNSNPAWSGDAVNMQVISNSTTSGLIGTEQNRTHTMKLNASSGPGSQYLSLPIGTVDAQQEWYFWIGRDNAQAATSANQIQMWLSGNESTLESNSIDGYRITYGDDSGGDEVRLQVVTDGVGTNIITSATSTANGLIDYGIAIKVTRSQTNVWTLYTSTLPQNSTDTQSTPTPLSCVATSATVNQGTATDATYAITGSGFVGPVFIHSSGVGERTSPEFDNYRLVALPPNTELKIVNLTSGSANEDVANTGNLLIEVQLTNPSTTVATTVDLVLTSGAAARAGRGQTVNTNYAGPYTTLTLTWAANTSGVQNVYIDPADNNLCDDIATLVFQLQNAVGGNNAFVGTPDSYTATIVDDNTGYDALLSETFESGSIPAQWVTTGTSWSASNAAPITGIYSARHSTQASSGTSSLAYPFDDITLPGVNTTWRFQIKYLNDPSANNNFQVFLAANEANFFSGTVDGYAVVVDQTSLPSAGTNDYIRLYRIDNGAYAATPIVNSTTDWDTNVNSGTKVGFEVTLNDLGTWELKVDANGDFDNLVSLGTGTDLGGGGLTYPLMQNFGIRYKYTAGVSNFIRFDDVTVSQKGCKELWYSQASGNVNASIWSLSTVGAPSTVIGGRYKRFRVQGSATGDNIPDVVTVNTDWIVNDISIDAGGTLNAGTFNTRVYGNWVNDGTFNSNTSTVTFKGSAAQSVLGSATSTFNNMVIDNDGTNVTLSVATEAKNVVTPLEGTLQTGGLLTLLSSVTGSASIGTINAAGAVSGNVTLQRYMPSIPWIYGNWVNLGSPIQGQTIADWNDDIITTGFTGSDYPAPYPFNNIRRYTESTAGVMNNGYVNATNVTDALASNTGYFVWMQGPVQNLDNTGAIQAGTFAHSLSYTVTAGGILNDGWNLMTNAYPSEVDWNLVSLGIGGGSPRVHYVFDHQTNTYKNWNAVSNTGTGSRYIPHSQSFLVKVNGVGQNLNYLETYKTNTGAIFERSYDETNQYAALKLERNGMSDECILMFNSDASAQYELFDSFDLESPNSDAVEFSLMSEDNIPLAQDSRPLLTDISIPVYLDLPTAGSYTFSVVETQSLPLGTCLMVEDLVSGESMMLQNGEQMTITTAAAYQGNRLLIHATTPVQVSTTDATCNGAANGTIAVTTPAGNWSVTLESMNSNSQFVANGSATFEHLPAGTYEVTVGNGEACTAGTQTVVIGEPAATHVLIADVAAPACNYGNGGSIEVQIPNANWFSYDLLNAKQQLTASGTVESNVLVIQNLNAGTYTLHTYTTCGQETTTITLADESSAQLQVLNTPQTVMLEGNDAIVTLEANANTGIVYWMCSDGVIRSGEMVNWTVTDPGIYTATVVAVTENCSISETVTFEVKIAQTEMVESGVSMIQTTDELQLTFGKDAPTGMIQIEVIDATGKLVMSESKPNMSGQRSIIPISQLAVGVYTIRVVSEGDLLFTRKIVK
ncbi:MAG: hypothetical protein ACKVOR_03375 [Flavobacteriales bacterium]